MVSSLVSIVFLIIQQSSDPGQLDHLLPGKYREVKHDVTVTIPFVGDYEIEKGHPVSKEYSKRQVYFERGAFTVKGHSLQLKPRGFFESPSRTDELSLLAGGMHPGYEKEFPDKASQKRFLSELKWRLGTVCKKHILTFEKSGGDIVLVLDGLRLIKDNTAKHG